MNWSSTSPIDYGPCPPCIHPLISFTWWILPGLPCFSLLFPFHVLLSAQTEDQNPGRPGNEASYFQDMQSIVHVILVRRNSNILRFLRVSVSNRSGCLVGRTRLAMHMTFVLCLNLVSLWDPMYYCQRWYHTKLSVSQSKVTVKGESSWIHWRENIHAPH